MLLLDLRWEPPYTGVARPSRPEIPKKSQKGLPGPPGLECPKSAQKFQRTRKRVKKVPKSVFGGHFFDALGGAGPEEDHFETSWGFWAQRAPGLLYMAVPIPISDGPTCAVLC